MRQRAYRGYARGLGESPAACLRQLPCEITVRVWCAPYDPVRSRTGQAGEIRVMRAALVAATAALPAFTPVPVTHANPDPDRTFQTWPPTTVLTAARNGSLLAPTVTACRTRTAHTGTSLERGPSTSGIHTRPPSTSPMRCVVNPDGGPLPQPAPPGRMRRRGPVGRSRLPGQRPCDRVATNSHR
jgi:hypothetical protein